jgi:hypothetical protein
MSNPDTLYFRVLKDRYYPDNDFLHATVSNRACATGRAIATGRDALQLGLIKRVGDGSLISNLNEK